MTGPMQYKIIIMFLTAFVAIGVAIGLVSTPAEPVPEPPPTPQEYLVAEIGRQDLADRDATILTEIIRCESGWEQLWSDGTVKVSNGNIGLAQINATAHEEEYKRLGLDPYDTFENLTYAVILYKREGVTPWRKWSGHCFVPALAEMGIVI